MMIEQDVLDVLKTHNSAPISGEKMAEQLNVSRTSIWKAIQSLRKKGYIIQSTTNKGYQLSKASDVLSSEDIQKAIGNTFDVYTFESIDSTNNRSKEYASSGNKKPAIFVAEEQTAGRGRIGRNFFSPKKSGIYVSLCVFPKEQSIQELSLVTAATSVAICRAIETLTQKSLSIKWVNDLFDEDKKVGGILTEIVTDIETQQVSALIVGIGLNLTPSTEKIPNEFQQIIGSISAEPTHSRNAYVIEIMNEWIKVMNDLKMKDFLHEYRSRSCVINKDVHVIQAGKIFKAHVQSIDNNGHLIVQDELGQLHTLSYGEISIRPI